jgi:hypothetical protein
MNRAALILLVVALLSLVLGIFNVAGITFEMGRVGAFCFGGLAVLVYGTRLITRRKLKDMP